MIKKKSRVQVPKLDSTKYVQALNDHNFGLMDEMTDEIEEAWQQVYKIVETGQARLAYYDTNKVTPENFLRYALHRSTRHKGFQLSCLWMKDGEMHPVSHADIFNAKEFLNRTRGLTGGCLVTMIA